MITYLLTYFPFTFFGFRTTLCDAHRTACVSNRPSDVVRGRDYYVRGKAWEKKYVFR